MAKKRLGDDENEYLHPDPEPDPVPTPQANENIGPYVDIGDGTGLFLLLDAGRAHQDQRQLPLIAMTGHKLILPDGEYLHVDEDEHGQWRYAASR